MKCHFKAVCVGGEVELRYRLYPGCRYTWMNSNQPHDHFYIWAIFGSRANFYSSEPASMFIKTSANNWPIFVSVLDFELVSMLS